jgi:nucleotide-binding universal stress UspA family protein
MLRSILVPLDGSPFGEHALPAALSLARRCRAKVHLVHVHTLLETTYAEITLFDGRRLDEEIRRTEKAYLEKLQKEIESKTGVTVAVMNVEGDTEPAIRAAAEKVAADLVVMATHARGPVGRFWLGSLADELVRDLPMPLLLVHPKKGAPELTAEFNVEHMLIPLDGTTLAEHMLEPAAELAGLTGADLTLLRVVKPVYPVMLPTEPAPLGGLAAELLDHIEEIQGQLKKEAEGYLEGAAQRLRERNLTVKTIVAVEEQPGSAILEQSHKPIDLIALETHGRHGLSRLLVGSVADRVIRGTPLPVLVHCSKG